MTRRNKHYPDPNQQELPFEQHVEACIGAVETLVEEIHTVGEPTDAADDIDSELELQVEIAAGCKRAIKESGRSREEILDIINRLYGRTGSAQATDPTDPDDRKRPLSIHMFNNYLSKPQECRIPPWVLKGIRIATGRPAPLEPLLLAGERIVTAEECGEFLLGKLETRLKEVKQLKRDLIRHLTSQQSREGMR